jgi:hypothetical protein
MPDIQSLHLALGAMTQKEREDFLGKALSHQPLESQDAILQKLDLTELPANSKVQLVFRMGMYPMAHAFRGGQDRQLRWVIPQVPDHLRTLVYSTSRLIAEFQETLGCLQHGRGDFVKAFTLLNPETMLEMVNRFSTEMQTYTQQLRDANGRFNRTGLQRGRPGSGPRPGASGQTAPNAVKEQSGKGQTGKDQSDKDQVNGEASASSPASTDTDTTRKARKANAKARTKDQAPVTEPAATASATESAVDAASGAEAGPAETSAGEDASQAEHQEQEPTPTADDTPTAEIAPALGTDAKAESAAKPSEETLAAFGFDVLALAAEKAGENQPEGESSGDSGK